MNLRLLASTIAVVAIALAPGCGPPALTCQSQTCPSNSGKTYQLCVNIDASQTWNFGGMSCHASSTDTAGTQNCENQVANYCTGGAGGSGGSGGGSCSIVGTFTATPNTGGSATMVVTGTSASGNFTLTINTSGGQQINIAGNYTTSGNDITLTNTSSSPSSVQGCIGQAAVYTMTWDSTCAHVTLNKVSDQCSGRIADANGNTLTRQ